MQLVTTHSSLNHLQQVDRLGVVASVLCAIHCAITPILLILLPTFGKAWSHPATHWGMALFIIPIALFMMLKSYKKHAKKKILYIGSIGILLIIVGAILPYVEKAPEPATAVAAQTSTCVDGCCPSFVANEQGEQSLHIPAASIVTTLGGLFLIALHAMNLCGCKVCKNSSQEKINVS